jgi:ketol-acid reductoisomerase
VRADPSRDTAEADGFVTTDLVGANHADVICVLVPDDVISILALSPRPDAVIIVASGYTLAFGPTESTMRRRDGGAPDARP